MSKTLLAIELARAGLPSRQIAKIVDSKHNSIKSMLSQARKRGIYVPYTGGGDRVDRYFAVHLSRVETCTVKEEAVRRQITPTDLVTRIVAAVIASNKFGVVLDAG